MLMEFIESHIFEKQVNALLSDDEFALFQGFLFSNPKAGAVIQQTGGLRKVRWAVQGKGKSGGVRVIYLYVTAAAQIRLIRDLQEGHQGRFECRREKDPEETQRKLVGSTMDKKLFADLVESMQQHNEIIAGTRKPARATKVDAQSIKVLRARAGLTQEKFAALIQVDLSTLRNWEQGRREPTGPAKALIRAITNDPKHVLKALEVGATMRKAG
jgi:putative transcriptional regulator